MPELEADLVLNTETAEASVTSLGTTIEASLTDSASSFSTAMETAISAVPAVTVEADTSNIEPTLNTAFDSIVGEVAVTAGSTDELVAGVYLAAAEIEAAVPISADVSGFAESVEAVTATSVPEVEIPVVADTEQAQQQIEELGATAQDSSGDLATMQGAATGVGAAAGLASGHVGGLGDAVGGLSAGAGAAVGAVAAVGTWMGVMFNNAVEAQGAAFRLENTLGDLAQKVNHIEVGNLNTDLSDLALTLGSDDDAMRNTAASAVNLGTSFGKTKGESADFAAGLLAITSRSVALNPSLGDAGSAAERLMRALQTGRERALLPFQLGLDKVEISQRAATLAMQDGRSEANAADKAFAGVQLAVEKFGTTLQEDIAQGAENPILKLKSLKQTLQENLEALGTPLVAPIFEVMEQMVPVADAAGKVLAELGSAALPIITLALEAVTPLIGAFADGLAALGPGALQVLGLALAFGKLTAILGIVQAALTAVTTHPILTIVGTIITAAGALGVFGGQAAEATQEVEAFTDALIAANGELDTTSRKAALAILEEKSQVDDLGRAQLQLVDVLESTSTAGGKQQQVLRDLADATGKFVDRTQGSKTAIKEAGGEYEGAGFRLKGLRDIQAEYIAEIAKANPALAEQLTRLSQQDSLNKGLIETFVQLAASQTEAASTLRDRNAVGADTIDSVNAETDAIEGQSEATKLLGEQWAGYTAALERMGQATDQFASQVSGGMPKVGDAFKNAVTAAQDAGRDFASALDFSSALSVTAEQAATFSANLVTLAEAGFVALAAEIGSQGPEAGGQIAQELADGIRNDSPQAAAAMEEMVVLVMARASVMDDVMREIASGFAPAMDSALGKAREAVANQLGYTYVEMADGTQKIVSIAAINFVKAQQAADAELGKIPVSTGDAMLDAQTAMQIGGENVASASRDAGDKTQDRFNSAIQPLPGWAGIAMRNATGEVEGEGHNTAGKGGDAGTDTSNKFGEGVAPLPGKAGNAVADAGAAMLLSLPSLIFTAVDLGAQVGNAFGEGVAAGIEAKTGRIKQAAGDALPGPGSVDAKGKGDAFGRAWAPPPGAAGGNVYARIASLLTGGLRISSSYRPPAYNAAVGGAPQSYHMDANNPALDIVGPVDQLDRLYAQLVQMGGWRELLWRTAGHYDHLHVAHQGGVVSRSWPSLPGLRHDERPAILQVGERVLRRSMARRGDETTMVLFRDFTVKVVGVSDPAAARAAGREVAEGMLDGATAAAKAGAI